MQLVTGSLRTATIRSTSGTALRWVSTTSGSGAASAAASAAAAAVREQALARVRASASDSVKLAVVDIDGVPRGKFVSRDKFLAAAANPAKTLGFCSVVFGWDCADVLYDNTKQVGWHMGYADLECKIDVTTLREVPWENNVPFALMDFEDATGKSLEFCPRSLLKSVARQVQTAGFGQANVGFEYEWFNFREDAKSLAAKSFTRPEHLTPGMFGYSLLRASQNREFFQALLRQLRQFGVPVEGLHTETGPGVMEGAIEYSEAVEAADRAILFKMGVKEIAHGFGIMPSFMARVNTNLPGCGGHFHVNLQNRDGSNAFVDPSKPHQMSETFQHFLAGQLHCLPHVLPMLAPTVNSYKRLVEGFWAPTTPTWGIENRTVSFRVIPGGKASRVEVRTAGADANPYLAAAASLASGLYGVKHRLPLQPPVSGNAYGAGGATDPSRRLASNLYDASRQMADSALAKELFGEVFVDHFTSTRIWEWRQFMKAVTDYEIGRYFEII